MIGAIAGDVIGSVYEHDPVKTENFPLFHRSCRFTDDTVMTIAIAYAIMESIDYALARLSNWWDKSSGIITPSTLRSGLKWHGIRCSFTIHLDDGSFALG